MKLWGVTVPLRLATSLGLAVVVAVTGINHQPVLGIGAVLAVEAARWWRRADWSLDRIQADCWLWLGGAASVIVITLTPNHVMQVILAAGYGWWRWWLVSRSGLEAPPMAVAAVTQGLVLWAVFLAAAVWHWPTLLILGLVWLCSWLIASQVLAPISDPAASVLALTWALIVAECSWVFSLWLVSYIVFGGIIIIPQPALVLTALGYCLAGIYVSHRRSQLSRTRLVEYLMIALVILAIVIAGTKWNGVI